MSWNGEMNVELVKKIVELQELLEKAMHEMVEQATKARDAWIDTRLVLPPKGRAVLGWWPANDSDKGAAFVVRLLRVDEQGKRIWVCVKDTFHASHGRWRGEEEEEGDWEPWLWRPLPNMPKVECAS